MLKCVLSIHTMFVGWFTLFMKSVSSYIHSLFNFSCNYKVTRLYNNRKILNEKRTMWWVEIGEVMGKI